MNALVNGRDRRGRKGGNVDGLPSVQSLNRWLNSEDRCPKPSAVPDHSTKLWHPMALEYFSRPQQPKVTWVHEQIVARWQPAFGPKPPSYDVVAHFFREKCSKQALAKGRHSGSALRSLTNYTQRDWSGRPAFFEVHADGWNTHFLVPREKDGAWETLEVWHFHDTRTRYVTPFGIGYSENRDVILEGLRECIRVGGVPAIWQTDSTGVVKNLEVSGFSKAKVKARAAGLADDGEDLQALADRLGITAIHPQEVGNSQANGIAENFNTWLDSESKVLATYMNKGFHDEKTFVKVKRLLGQLETACKRAGAIGATDEDRARPAQLREQIERVGKGHVFGSEAEARAWLLDLVDKWNNLPHEGLPKRLDLATGKQRHMTPAEALDEALAEMRAQGEELHLLSDEQTADLFRPHLKRKVFRGAVSLHNSQRYLCAELAHIEGSEVLVVPHKTDPYHVQVKDLQGRLIGVAELQSAKTPRVTTTDENARMKRADARIRHKEQQIEQIEREKDGLAIEHAPTGAALPGWFGGGNVIEGTAIEVPQPPAPDAPLNLMDIALAEVKAREAGAKEREEREWEEAMAERAARKARWAEQEAAAQRQRDAENAALQEQMDRSRAAKAAAAAAEKAEREAAEAAWRADLERRRAPQPVSGPGSEPGNDPQQQPPVFDRAVGA